MMAGAKRENFMVVKEKRNCGEPEWVERRRVVLLLSWKDCWWDEDQDVVGSVPFYT
jgi:hypothetical protein